VFFLDLLRHKDSPYIRAIGFLYLRCILDPKLLWGWFEPYLNDSTLFVPGQQDKTPKTMGVYVRELLERNEYYGMKLRRIPIPIQRDYQLKLIANDTRIKRGEKNEPYRHLIVKGLKLQGEYLPDSKFYDVVIDRLVGEGVNGRFIVTYLEYGNQDELEIGSLKLPQEIIDSIQSNNHIEKVSESSRDRYSPHSSRDRDRDPSIRDHDRDRSSRDRDSYNQNRDRRRSRSRERYREYDRDERRPYRSRSRSPHHSHHRSNNRDVFDDLPPARSRDSASSSSSSHHSHRDYRPSHRSRSPSPSPEARLQSMIQRDRESSVAQGKDYARKTQSFQVGLSMSSLSATTRKRSRTPPPRIERNSNRENAASSPTTVPQKPVMSEEAKAARAALIQKYGDSASQKEKILANAKGGSKNEEEDDDIIRLGM
jgi:pre-mRNA-splicing factor 38B